jgi:hypothetical protein
MNSQSKFLINFEKKPVTSCNGTSSKDKNTTVSGRALAVRWADAGA